MRQAVHSVHNDYTERSAPQRVRDFLPADTLHFNPNTFKPFRLTLLFLKAIRLLYPDYKIWRKFAYEYETERLPIDVINGGTAVREWVDNNDASIHDLEVMLKQHEQEWFDSIQEFLIY